MSQIHITLKDGNVKTFPMGVSAIEIAQSISNKLAKQTLIAKSSDRLVELHEKINQDLKLEFLTWNDPEGKSTFWHSSAHILAQAICFYYPNVKLGIGPAIENGFYYDIDLGEDILNDEAIKKIEHKFLEFCRQANTFIKKNVSKTEAIEYFTEKQDPYKLELLENLKEGEITFYTQGTFTDLCRGPHIPHTQLVQSVKILSLAGAYWRGNEKNKMLTRVYAISFPTEKEMDDYLKMIEEAQKRDHRKIGKALQLFTFSEKVGLGLPLWLPKGAIVRDILQKFLQKKQTEIGYLPVITPHIGHIDLYKTSGHYEKYGIDSFQAIHTPQEGEMFLLKPMNCPHHCEIYKSQPRSYKDLPIRYAEFGTVYRYEQHGELHGLTRVRGFTQDDAHLFCRPEQVKEEFIKVIELTLYVFESLGFKNFTAQISLRDKHNKEKYIGSDENWTLAEQAIIEAAQQKKLSTIIEYGEAAFYGPKLDFMVKDSIGRKWQLGTIQVDYNLPIRFNLEYIDSDNTKKTPIMIHRAPFGSMERFIALLIEHCEGNFPFWLAPIQMVVIPVSDKLADYATSLHTKLITLGFRCECDLTNEKIGKKIRNHELQKIPYMIIIGEKEIAQNNIAVREHKRGDIGTLAFEEFIKILQAHQA